MEGSDQFGISELPLTLSEILRVRLWPWLWSPRHLGRCLWRSAWVEQVRTPRFFMCLPEWRWC